MARGRRRRFARSRAPSGDPAPSSWTASRSGAGRQPERGPGGGPGPRGWEGRRGGGGREAAARAGIAHVPEGRGTFVDLSVTENLKLGAYTRRDRQAKAGMQRAP